MKTRKVLFALLAAVFVFSLQTSCTAIISQTLKLTPKENKVKVEKNVMVLTRDGLHLATDIYMPRKAGKYPVILCRLPYGKNGMGQMGRLYAQRGYIFVVQDCRATFNSEGDSFIPFVNDVDDGQDTVKWVAQQPWFNGEMALWGASYFGYTQWMVADNNPYLKVFYPEITTPNMYRAIFTGGAFHYALANGWSKGVGKQNGGNAITSIVGGSKPKFDPEKALFNKPLKWDIKYSFEELGKMPIEQLSVVLGLAPADAPNKPYPDATQKMIDLFAYPGFAYHSPTFNFFDRYKDVKAPALLIAGWYDIFLDPQLYDFVQMRTVAQEPARSNTHIIIGPWGHATLGDPQAVKGARSMELFRKMFDVAWFDHWLKGKKDAVDQMAPVKIYVMGKNVWRNENEWPLARTKYTSFFISSLGNAATRDGNGVLSMNESGKVETTDDFKFDPLDPVPTMGGNNLIIDGGALDQKKVELRKDVLVYTSAPMTQEMEVTGPIKMVLWAASSAKDTDFTAKLCVVQKNGLSLNLADGIVRARYHEGYDHAALIKSGEPIEYEINLWDTSYAFQPGEKIRLQISSSNFPRFDINSNCAGEGGAKCAQKAYQSIYHDKNHPSRLVLPVIPAQP